jgi:thiosulfate dehydrogenase [quinone] large subunit
MNKYFDIVLVILRVVMGWFFFYAGITKVLNPEWSAAFYLKDAQTFSSFFEFLLQPGILPIVNFMNAWGLTLLGMSLILGIFVKISAPLGALLMILYYFPELNFPYVGEHSMIIDDHIIYAIILILLMVSNAGAKFGLDRFIFSKTISRR